MNIILVSPGKNKNSELNILIEDFESRISKFSPISLDFFKVRKNENDEILERISKLQGKTVFWVWDETGKEFTSKELSGILQNTINSSPTNLVLIVGGAYGLDDRIKNLGKTKGSILALSKMTFTHEMARTLVLEQIYRAFSILSGLPYHH